MRSEVDRALVLGGGGVTGIAWEVGLLLGMKRAGVELTPDLIIGTSAGSVVGAMIATGQDLEHIAVEQRSPDPDEKPIHADMNPVMAAFGVLFDSSRQPNEARAEVGRMALEAAADMGDEESYVRRFAGRLGKTTWPTKPRLVLTGVDVLSGEPVAWDASAGVPLLQAVAASCAVPCIFPPVTVGGRRYMDGGVRSPINGDLAVGAKKVLVIAPMLQFSFGWAGERAKLEGSDVVVIGPDAATLEAIGPNVMDTSRRLHAFEAGLAQGAAEAAKF